MAQNDSAGTGAFANPLDGLTKPQVKQLARTVQQLAGINESMEQARKTLEDSRFTVRAGYSPEESAKAVQSAKAAEKTQEKSEASLKKLSEKFKGNQPMKAALAVYQHLEKAAAGGNPAAKSLLDEVNADLTIAATPSPARVRKTAAKDDAIETLLNGIGAGRVAKKEARVGELTEQARAQVEDRKRREPNEFLEPARQAFPNSLLARYALRGNEVVDKRTDAVAFVDSGKELRAGGDVGRDVIDAMLDTADSRGWAPIKVFGTQAFKAAVWMEAASRGMDVTGYKPSAQELEVAAQNRQVNGRENTIAVGATKSAATVDSRLQEMTKAFQEAGTARQQARAAKTFPELANAFALLSTFEKAIAKPGLARNDSRDFVDQFKDLVVDRLQNGKALPTVTLAELDQQKTQPQQAQPDRER